MKVLLQNEVSFVQIVDGKINLKRPLLWSSGQCSWLHIQKSRVRFQTLPNFLSSSSSGTGSTQSREVK
jgi:predicted ferric reductase